MADGTKIEWTDATWNPIVGCSVLSPGCTNCYAMKMAWRLANNPATPHYAGTVELVKGKPVWTGKVALAPDRVLAESLRRKKPTTYFVNSMGDLFHENVPDEWIDKVFAVMAMCPQHTFQVLTKRAARMREYVESVDPEALNEFGQPIAWPLANVWLGVSAERQREWDERGEHLRQTPAAVHFASFEPLLGAINGIQDWLSWVIVGGESGPGARPMHPDWPRALRDQCQAAQVPFFFKQWGEWGPDDGPLSDGSDPVMDKPLPAAWFDGTRWHFADNGFAIDLVASRGHGAWVYRFGKKAAGRTLDGRIWDEMPEARR